MNELLASERPDHIASDEVTDGFIGQAPAFRDVLAKLPKLASADAAVLISGETGTGKELVARAIHGMSRRTMSPFVAVNCGALIDTLFESELFGHERGAFTDAHARRQGLMAQAAGGTLFLDEADTLTPRGQVALLRALQDRTFRPLGSTTEHRVDVRFLAATNARLERMVDGGAFRADLYYRLCVFLVTLPPLRDRREDILPLAYHFLGKYGASSSPASSRGGSRRGRRCRSELRLAPDGGVACEAQDGGAISRVAVARVRRIRRTEKTRVSRAIAAIAKRSTLPIRPWITSPTL